MYDSGFLIGGGFGAFLESRYEQSGEEEVAFEMGKLGYHGWKDKHLPIVLVANCRSYPCALTSLTSGHITPL